MRICHFEDPQAATLEPIALSRPVFELRCGINTLAQKQRRFFQADATGALIRPYLADVFSQANPHIAVNELDWLALDTTVLVNGRWLPPPRPMQADPAMLGDAPLVALVDDEIAYAVLPADELAQCRPGRLPQCLEQWRRDLPGRPAGGQLLRYLWDAVDANAEQIGVDFQSLRGAESAGRPGTLALVGPSDWLCVDPTARIDPYVVADTTNGPVIIERDVVVSPFTHLEGPCWIGPRTHLLGAKVRSGASIGPNCRIGGEIEASIILGHSNKYHEGFLGHSYVGAWVNLGAGTHTSDLRNDYGEVAMVVDGVRTPTGRRKVGSFLGDHAKTGLGSLLNTGTNVGVFANLLPAGELLPRYVPSFCRVEHGCLTDRADISALFATAVKAMQRRGEEFDEARAAMYKHLFDQTAVGRRQACRDAEKKRLRRSA